MQEIVHIPSYKAVIASELNTGAGLAKIIENEIPATLWKLSSASVTYKFYNTGSSYQHDGYAKHTV